MGILTSQKQASEGVEYAALPQIGNGGARLGRRGWGKRWMLGSGIAVLLVMLFGLSRYSDMRVQLAKGYGQSDEPEKPAAVDGTALLASSSPTSIPLPSLDSQSMAGIATHSPSSTPSPDSVGQDYASQDSFETPILGAKEDPFNLYYPAAHTSRSIRPLPHNAPPSTRLRTPLFISFTRNADLLHQTLLSYIASGWPASEIVVIDNSGTMDANPSGQLSSSNPFYLNYTLLRQELGVSVLQTPTLLSFSQLMNFYLRTAMARGWETFFWSHMDVVILSDESVISYKSFYQNVLDVLHNTTAEGEKTSWAVRFFDYDYLTLVNVEAWRKTGQWDTFIPYYASDCDAYSRVYMSGLDSRERTKVSAGRIFDVADVVPDLESKLFGLANETIEGDPQLNSPRYKALRWELQKLERFKKSDQGSHRNSWQGRKKGGVGEPWTYDLEGFERAWWITAGNGQQVFEKKWGTRMCELDLDGKSSEQIWKAKEPEAGQG